VASIRKLHLSAMGRSRLRLLQGVLRLELGDPQAREQFLAVLDPRLAPRHFQACGVDPGLPLHEIDRFDLRRRTGSDRRSESGLAPAFLRHRPTISRDGPGGGVALMYTFSPCSLASTATSSRAIALRSSSL
jgi:hypothetical protein